MNVLLISLGCDKNTCDSEEMLGIINSEGYNIINNEQEADIIIINTCCFIRDAMEESINTVLEMAKLKEDRLKYLIVAGCLSERYKEEIENEIPEIDAFLGTTSFDKIVEVIKELENDNKNVKLTNGAIKKYSDINSLPIVTTKRIITTSTFMSYLKIAEGCNKNCTYCIIPSIRGKYRSVPMEKLIEDANFLANQGIKELVLVAQETTCYGIDLYGNKSLHVLIQELSKIKGIEWIRLMYCYPEEIYGDLINEFAINSKLCHYIDMPLQHSEDNILKRMGRKTDKESILKIISRLREVVPDIAIRTSLISGFPGETKEDHEALLDFVNDVEFDRLGVFVYSREENTPAANFLDQVDEELATKWRNEIMELQQEISFEINEKMIGQTLEVIIEGYIPDDDIYVGRSYKDAPNVDSFVFVKSNYELMSGSIVPVIITKASEYDIIGEVKE